MAPVEGGLSAKIDRQERVSGLCAELHSDSLGSAGLRAPTVSGLPTLPCLCPVLLPKTRDQVHPESLSSGCCGFCWVPPGVFSCLCPLVPGESASPGTSPGSREGPCFMKWGVTGKHSEPHGLASVSHPVNWSAHLGASRPSSPGEGHMGPGVGQLVSLLGPVGTAVCAYSSMFMRSCQEGPHIAMLNLVMTGCSDYTPPTICPPGLWRLPKHLHPLCEG